MNLYGTIIYEVKKQLGITVTDYLLLDAVKQLQYRTGRCYKSRSKMAETMDLSKGGVMTAFARLIAKGLLEKNEKGDVRVTDIFINLTTEKIGNNGLPLDDEIGNNGLPSGNNGLPKKDEIGNNGLPPSKNTNKKNTLRKDDDPKLLYQDFVYLTQKEYDKLTTRLGDKERDEYINSLNIYIGKKQSDPYKSHYYTILDRYGRAKKEEANTKTTQAKTRGVVGSAKRVVGIGQIG